MPECELKKRFRLDLEEVSALCARPHPDGGAELLAVGDEDFAVVAATLVDDALENARRTELGDALNDERATGTRDRSGRRLPPTVKAGCSWSARAAPRSLCSHPT